MKRNRSEIKEVLHLNLKKKWFDMIASGKKKEEYRELKPYWIKRLIDINYPWETAEEKESDLRVIPKNIQYDIIKNGFSPEKVMDAYCAEFKKVRLIIFSNGYSRNRPQLEIECHSIEINHGIEEWGAEKGKIYIVLKFGNL